MWLKVSLTNAAQLTDNGDADALSENHYGTTVY